MHKYEVVEALIRDGIEPFEVRQVARWAGCSVATVSRAIDRYFDDRLLFVWQCRKGGYYRLYFTRDWEVWEIFDFLRSRNKSGKTQAKLHVCGHARM